MQHERPSEGRAPRRKTSAALLLVLLAAASCLAHISTHAQSGRRKPPPLSPVPTPTPTPEPEGESESESRPKRKDVEGQLTFGIHPAESVFVDRRVEDLVVREFFERLRRQGSISVTLGAKLTRGEVQKRAKNDTDTWAVFVEIEEDSLTGSGGIGTQGDTRLMVVKTYAYEPKTGALKYVDTTRQRPYRRTTNVGGVGIPLPVPRTIERFPNELQLEQAARDAADRLMLRFKLRLPPDN